MELNREQIIKALEHCINDATCEQCQLSPYTCHIQEDALALITSQEQRIGAQDMTISELRQRAEKAEHDADRYAQKIKELTEENERLIAEVSVKKKLLDKCVDLEDKVIADTVRKMQDRFNEVFDGMDATQALLRRTFDHIVKEMLEAENEKEKGF